MFDVYKLLNKHSVQSSMLPNDRLLFEFGEYVVAFDLESFEKNGEDLYQHNLGSFDFKRLAKRQVFNCFISSSEYLGWRADIIDFKKPISICYKMYAALEIIERIQPFSVLEYRLAQNEEYDEVAEAATFCNTEPNYIFEIYLNKSNYSNPVFFEQLLGKLHIDDEDSLPPYFYWPFYKKYKKIEDSKKLSIINTNTKVRRLGYFKLLSDFIRQRERISANFINRKFEKYVIKYKDELSAYKNNKGLIKKTRTGVSAKPYIDTAKDLKFLNLLNNVYSSGKIFKVYHVLKNEFGEKGENTFILNKMDKLFFLETILREDFLYTSLLLEAIKLKTQTNYAELVQIFQPLLLGRLNQFLQSMQFEQSTKVYREIKKVAERIKKWKGAEIYLEHILMPRLNWLLDLELLEMDKNLNIKMNEKGLKLFENLCCWNDINWERVISPDEFLNLFSVHLFDNVYYDLQKKGRMTERPEEEINSKIIQYIGQSFEYFQTLAPNRVTASQAITYTKYKLYLIDGIKIGHRFIVNFLESKGRNTFVYKFQKQYGDGYIQKIKV